MTRTRRRVLIATIAALAMIGVVWWLSRPQIDPRLVGRWAIMDEVGPIGEVFVLSGDGRGIIDVLNEDWTAVIETPDSFSWRVKDQQFVLLPRSGNPLADLYERLRFQFTGKSRAVLCWDLRYSVASESRIDRVDLTTPDGHAAMNMRLGRIVDERSFQPIAEAVAP